MHLGPDSEFQIPESVFKTPRLSIFEELTENCNEDDNWTQPNSSNSNSNKKPMLSKQSRAFHMPAGRERRVSDFAKSLSPEQMW